MSRVVTFMDTSVVVEVLGIPGKSQQPDVIRDELRHRTAAGESLVLPTAAIIETGNHIAQLPGPHRRRYAELFSTLLCATAEGRAPWVVNGARWDESLITKLHAGARGCPSFPDMATQGVGLGDVSILAEAESYATRVRHVNVRIWTLERALAAFA